MHEMSLMAGVFEVINQNLTGYEDKKVTKVKLLVGQLTNAVPDALDMAFEVFSQGTQVEGAELEIEIVPLVIECDECGLESQLDKPVFRCPNCNSLALRTISGRELRVESLEVE